MRTRRLKAEKESGVDRLAGRSLAKSLPSTIIALGFVSFFTDFSSEMIYPLLPLFLSGVLGCGAMTLGVVEGVAESTASLFKVASGIWTDRWGRRKPFIVAGYGLAGFVRPLIGLASVWPTVAIIRFADRVGKGLRTSPRDALIADVAHPSQRGQAYGFHRAMDHAGAVVGPLAAAGLLALGGVSMRHVFFLAVIPAIVVMVILVTKVKEPPAPADQRPEPIPLRAGWNDLGKDYRLFLGAMLIFTLGNSTDAFLLLRLSEAGVPAAWVAVLWSALHVVKMAATYFGGLFSDRIGRRRMILGGWLVYAAIYLAFALVHSPAALTAIFLAYGLYFGLTEPSEKAWVADLVPERLRGSAFGYYHGVVGLAALPASLLFGLLWRTWGAPAAFMTGAALAAAASVPLLFIRPAAQPTA